MTKRTQIGGYKFKPFLVETEHFESGWATNEWYILAECDTKEAAIAELRAWRRDFPSQPLRITAL